MLDLLYRLCFSCIYLDLPCQLYFSFIYFDLLYRVCFSFIYFDWQCRWCFSYIYLDLLCRLCFSFIYFDLLCRFCFSCIFNSFDCVTRTCILLGCLPFVTGWRRPIGYLKLQVIFRKSATTYRALSRKMTCKDKASYASSPPPIICVMCIYTLRYLTNILLRHGCATLPTKPWFAFYTDGDRELSFGDFQFVWFWIFHRCIDQWQRRQTVYCLAQRWRQRTDERWGAGVETQKNVRGEIGGWGRVPFNEPYAPSLSTIYDGA